MRSQADQIIADANRQADGVRKRAEEEGKQAAMQAAEKVLDDKVGQRMQTALPALQQVIAGIADAKQAWLGHWERMRREARNRDRRQGHPPRRDQRA